MAGHRRRDLIARRRQPEDEEEEEGSLGAEVEDDSLSEGSLLSDGEEDEDEEADEEDDAGKKTGSMQNGGDDPPVRKTGPSALSGNQINGQDPNRIDTSTEKGLSTGAEASETVAVTDTEAMMNGLQISSQSNEADALEFDDVQDGTDQQPKAVGLPENRHDTVTDRRRREHDEYRKKRDTDPAFVPNRGGFFMHDHRSAGPGQNGFRPFGRGRGRGRGAIGGPFSPANQVQQPSEVTDAPWAHDLHETLSQPETGPSLPIAGASNDRFEDAARPPPSAPRGSPLGRSFSRTVHIGNVQIRVYLSGMKEPVTFSAVPVKQHTRLPQHRPPLRRDKPVRISLPDHAPRYIFPAMDRSFIFIPRAMRPNQQGYGRPRGRGGFGQHSGLGSRRTSVYGGSLYSPSVAMSRRSSLAREVSRDSIISPTGSTVSRTALIPVQPGKAVVRLPPSAPGPRSDQEISHSHPQQQPNGIQPVVNLPHRQAYATPGTPTYRENQTVPLTMHQPRPQKTVSVADIESPESAPFQAPQQQQEQPFHHQVPTQVNGHHPYPQDGTAYPHSRHPSFPSQASGGTPLSHIPERAIHAQPFQPHLYSQQAYPGGTFPQPLPAQGGFYYPSYAGAMAPAAAAPAFVPGQAQPPYVVPAAPPAPATGVPPATVAHESNGMVYYYDSAQVYAGPVSNASFPASGYVVPPAGGVVGIGGMITPSPDVYYYPQPVQGEVYYSQ